MADEKQGKPQNLTVVERAKAERNHKMWQMRLALIQRGQKAMQLKRYSDAVVSYEKYIRILELIFEVPKGQQLTPEVFKESAKTSEMSVLASAYWDLVRIYDTSPQYGDRQSKCASQLALFAHLTPVYTDIVKQAQEFVKTARQPERVKVFLASAGKTSRCFIATAAYQSPNHSDVMFLRNYRDSVLKQSFLGRKFIYFYYRYSPKVACILDRHEFLKAPTRWALKFVIKCVRQKNPRT